MTGLRLAAATVVAGLLLGACTDDPEPNIDTDPSSSAPTASVSTSAPTSPTTAETTPAALGPQEVVMAWVVARNAALQNGDTTEVDQLSATVCRTCTDSVDPIRQVYAAGGHFETTGWDVVAAKVESQTADTAKVSTAIRYAAGRTVPERGADAVTYGIERHIVIFKLVPHESSWQVSFIGYLS